MGKKKDGENEREITFAEAMREATDQAMEEDENVFIIGEGVPDPKGVFGTTLHLQKKYGKRRVLDMPVSENGLTGVCIGAAIRGLRPIMVHQRIDFSLLCMDQIMNNAAKWYSMYGGQQSVPLVIRMIIGRGWGQGAQHSQNIQAFFAHMPGLKVVMPTTAYDAKGLFMASIKDNNPVIFIEHRWLQNMTSHVPEKPYTVPLGKSNILRTGGDITIAATSYMTVEALRAAEYLKNYGVDVEIVDVRTLKPLDDATIIDSAKKTGHFLAVDLGYYSCGFAGELVARVSENAFSSLKSAPTRISLPENPGSSSPGITKYYYPRFPDIVRKISAMLKRDGIPLPKIGESIALDVPDATFKGPF